MIHFISTISSGGKLQKIRNVLLIDDSQSTNMMHFGMLAEVVPGARINSFTDADHALSYLEKEVKEKPDIIFLDLVMPNKDGFEFLDDFLDKHKSFTYENSPLLVLVSAYLNQENFNLSKGYRMLGLNVDHVKKPLTKQDIQELLEEHF